MNNQLNIKKKAIIGSISAVAVTTAVVGGMLTINPTEAEPQELSITSAQPSDFYTAGYVEDVKFPEALYKQEGYDNVADYWAALQDLRKPYEGRTQTVKDELEDFVSEDQYNNLLSLEDKIVNSLNISDVKNDIKLFDDTVETIRQNKVNAESYIELATPTTDAYVTDQYDSPAYGNSSYGFSYSSGSSYPDLYTAGVIYDNGYRYTYYSSNVLWHYRTNEWSAGSDGIYRDANGNVIVASSDHPQGSIVSTPYGSGIVQDSGCASGTLDIYTSW